MELKIKTFFSTSEQTKYVNLGTAGIALVGNFDLHIYQIILYKNKKDYISKMHLSPNFTFTIMENNYASFYDDGRQNWSVLFSSLADVQAFGKEVGDICLSLQRDIRFKVHSICFLI